MYSAGRLRIRGRRARARRQHGLSYIEVLVATVLVAVSLVPAVEALRGGIFGARVHQAAAEDHYRLEARLEEVLAEPYALLDAAAVAAGSQTTATSYSDPAGAANRRLVYLARYDAGSGSFTAADTGLLWVRIAYESPPGELLTLTAR